MDVQRGSISPTWSSPSTGNTGEMPMSTDNAAFFDAFYRQYHLRVLAYLRFRVRTDEAAEELAAQVFERALLHLADLREPEAAAAWLFRIAHNCVADYFRHTRREISLEWLIRREHPRTPSLEETVLANEEWRLLLAHVDQLPEREREVIGLKFVGHLTNREIARVLSLPEGTVGSLLYRTLVKLRNALREEGGMP
ncbi:MAG TPA: sigma-70 family RNA polymerase sigma factor [Ktedonobacteraceae bacterium]